MGPRDPRRVGLASGVAFFLKQWGGPPGTTAAGAAWTAASTATCPTPGVPDDDILF